MQAVSTLSTTRNTVDRTMSKVGPNTIAVVILNWNSIEDTTKCLNSLFDQPYKDIYPIVVDNASTSNEGRELSLRFPTIEVLQQPLNLGFARGVNEGLRKAFDAGARYVLLLNNDSWFEPTESTIGLLKEQLDSDSTLGGVGPIVCEGNDPRIIQSAGHMFNLFTAFPQRLMSGKDRTEPVPTTRPTYIVGACLLMPAALLRRLGGMDPDYFLYGDDIDLALNMHKLGYGQGLVPGAFVYHKKAAATTMWSENHTYTMLRSHLIVCWKQARWFHWPTLFPSLLVITAGLMLFGLRNGHPLAIKGAIRAWYDFLTGRWGGYRGGRLEGSLGCISPDPSVAL